MLKYLLYLIIFISINVSGQVSIDSFFNDQYKKYPSYIEFRNPEYIEFCKIFSIDLNSQVNKDIFFNIHFLHDLFTGISAENYISGGILNIPYFWHWVNPNPRHDIIMIESQTTLSKIKPPNDFNKYKSYADIDRIPSLFLKDLLSDKPKYFHDNCNEFYTFGWCSEREMAFNTLLGIIGYNLKIKQTGIHTWSEIYTNLINTDKQSVVIIFKIDNTFDIVEYFKPNQANFLENWRKDIGHGSQIKWYNKKAHLISEIKQVKNIKVTDIVSSRINNLIVNWLNDL